MVSRDIGVDYAKVLDLAKTKDPRALRLFIWLGVNAGFDAASSEGYGWDLGQLCTTVGDKDIAALLALHGSKARSMVRDHLRFEYQDSTESVQVADRNLRIALPLTAEVLLGK